MGQIPHASVRRYAWVIVGLLWVVALLNYLDRQIIFSVLPLVKTELNLSNIQLGLLSTVFLWVYGFLSPFAGYLADRFGNKRVILFGLFVWSVVTWATGQSHTFTQLLMARGIMGVSEACYLPAGLALIASLHGQRTRSLATGIHFSGLYVGIIIGGFGGGWMGEHYGWRSAFGILGIAGVVYSIFLRFVFKGTPEPSPEQSRSPHMGFLTALHELLRLPGFITLTCVFAGMAIANWLVFTWLPLFLYEHFQMSMAKAGFVATFYNQAGCLIGMSAGGWLVDRWAQTNFRARLWAQALALAAASPSLLLAGSTQSQLLLAFGLTGFGIARATFDCTAMPLLCEIARPELRATGYGFFNGAGCIAGGVMATGAGWMKATLGLTSSFYVAAAILLLSAIGVLWVPVAPRKSSGRQPILAVVIEPV